MILRSYEWLGVLPDLFKISVISPNLNGENHGKKKTDPATFHSTKNPKSQYMDIFMKFPVNYKFEETIRINSTLLNKVLFWQIFFGV